MSTLDYSINELFEGPKIKFVTRYENIKLTIECSHCIESDKINSIKCDQVDILQTNIQLEMGNKLIKTSFNASCIKERKNSQPVYQINTEPDAKTITASWQSPSNDIIYYLLYLIDKTGQYIYKIINNNSFLFDNLNEKSLYQICIATINNKWITSLFTCKQILTDFLSTGPVTNINVSADIDKIYLSWKKPEYKHDIPQGYIVHLRSDDTKLCRIIIISMTNSQITNTDQSCRNEQHKIWRELLQLEIDNLPSYSRFTISITPINNNKNAVNEYRSIQTKEGESEPVREIKINRINSGYVGIEFKEPSQPNGKVIKYRIRIILIKNNICTNNMSQVVHEIFTEKLYEWININIFKKCGSYLLEISPINGWHLNNGVGKSESISFQYPLDSQKKDNPISVNAQFISQNSIALHLNLSQNNNQCDIMGIIVEIINENNSSDCTIKTFTNNRCQQLINEVNKMCPKNVLIDKSLPIKAIFSGMNQNSMRYKYKISQITDIINIINSGNIDDNKIIGGVNKMVIIIIFLIFLFLLNGILFVIFSKKRGTIFINRKENENKFNITSNKKTNDFHKEEYSIPIDQFCSKYHNYKLNAFKQIIKEYSILISEIKSFNENMNNKISNKLDKYSNKIWLVDKYRVKSNSVKIDKDILNASYIPFVNDDTKMEYIVSHNPIIDNVHIFWEMIWNENINFIILLTKMTSNEIFDCIQYWPTNVGQSNYYGNNNQYTVSLEEEIDQDCYYERTFTMIKIKDYRKIKQLHIYKSIDLSTSNFEDIDKFMYRFHEITNDTNTTPYLIHSRKQENEIAALMCVDRIIKELVQENKTINILDTSCKLVMYRNCSITQNQYLLIYDFMNYFLKKYSDSTYSNGIYFNSETL